MTTESTPKPNIVQPPIPRHSLDHQSLLARTCLILLPFVLFALAAFYQLGLPGLHYDEAKEAGVNAMELLTGAPVTAFRNTKVTLFEQSLPLMVQDYIGAANVYLALPILNLTGIGVPNLRILSIIVGLLAMLFLALAVSQWMQFFDSHNRYPTEPASGASASPTPPESRNTLHSASLITLFLLALSPSFVFWSRQGIYVTNLMQPLSYFCLWQGLRWLNRRSTLSAILCAFSAGLALYVKIQAIWIVGPFGLLLIIWILLQRNYLKHITLRVVIVSAIAFLLPLLPLLLFNTRTGGLVEAIAGNASRSYYGVDNADLLSNLAIRWKQVGQVLRGDHFWYLGGIFANRIAPFIAIGAILLALWHDYRKMIPPLLLLLMAFAGSLFTISDLFINHYALLQPLLIAVVGIALSTFLHVTWTMRDVSAAAAMIAIIAWGAADLLATTRYHQVLAQSGGLADHSDATYHLAHHLRYNGLGAPITLDWGMDAPVRYLTEGTVTPIEIFGYASPKEPDSNYTERLQLFIDNPDNVYLLRSPENTVFEGRREEFIYEAEMIGRKPVLEKVFSQRDNVPLYELWRLE